jgi:2-polyprenyl-3-methyl-5-hydroxy-6-metoxy-1,4-benzoquinol methylase
MATGNYLEKILAKIESQNPAHAQKLKDNTSYLDEVYLERANEFYGEYHRFLIENGSTLDFGVACYLKMLEDMAIERTEFLRQGRYTSTTFDEVDKCYYNKPEVMCYHMHGLVLAQFLWFDQYERFSFFADGLKKYGSNSRSYLEIGGGHGLYCFEALKTLPRFSTFEFIDTSASSLMLGEGIINSKRVNFLQKNVLEYVSNTTFDFVTMGEVLEHVEEPLLLLNKLSELIGSSGTAFISTPVNAPMIDHIYLFNNVQEIRDITLNAGLDIISEKIVISAHVSQRYADKFKVPVMFAAFIQQKH